MSRPQTRRFDPARPCATTCWHSNTPGAGPIANHIFQTISGEETDPREARNGLRHIVSLTASKLADGLIDPKLILSWLLTSLGAPAVLVGLLVPIREAGALLPQILLSGWLRRLRQRKRFWAAGAVGQGVSAGLIALAALTLTGQAAGLAICAALAALALSRAACSVSYKDVLGKTVEKSRRGSVTGAAGSVSAAGVIGLGVLLLTDVLRSETAVVMAIALAACLWLAAAALMLRLEEAPSTPEDEARPDLSPLWRDRQLQLFILVRGMLVPTALAPPYFVLLASQSGGLALDRLGVLVLVSAAASFLSSYVWGRLADRSSRWVLILTGLIGAAAMLAAVGARALGLTQTVWAIPLALFLLMLAYHGVRQGRSTYLVDMAPEDKRATYAALANTAIGTLLLVAGTLGGLAALIGPSAALIGFAALCLAASGVALWLDEVE
ncbi:MFS transporter [Marinovum sp.]|uniref:MFS transporter n=1 Tax=Marinovum sp. TaxID=2024839 RepID=UPI002B266544|nr:MFS transporter [Marinovum sp.]